MSKHMDVAGKWGCHCERVSYKCAMGEGQEESYDGEE